MRSGPASVLLDKIFVSERADQWHSSSTLFDTRIFYQTTLAWRICTCHVPTYTLACKWKGAIKKNAILYFVLSPSYRVLKTCISMTTSWVLFCQIFYFTCYISVKTTTYILELSKNLSDWKIGRSSRRTWLAGVSIKWWSQQSSTARRQAMARYDPSRGRAAAVAATSTGLPFPRTTPWEPLYFRI